MKSTSDNRNSISIGSKIFLKYVQKYLRCSNLVYVGPVNKANVIFDLSFIPEKHSTCQKYLK